MLPQIMSVNEAAEQLKVQPSTVRTWIRQEILTATKVGKRYFITENEVTRMLTAEKPKINNRRLDKMTRSDRVAEVLSCLSIRGITSEEILTARLQRSQSRLNQLGGYRS